MGRVWRGPVAGGEGVEGWGSDGSSAEEGGGVEEKGRSGGHRKGGGQVMKGS